MTTTRKLVVDACGLSAGVHAGLVPAHLDESPLLGVAFVVSVVLLIGTAAWLVARPDSRWGPRAAAVLFAGLIGAYVLVSKEPVDGLAAGTKAVEGLGLVLSLRLARFSSPLPARPALSAGAIAFGLCFVLALVLSTEAGHAH